MLQSLEVFSKWSSFESPLCCIDPCRLSGEACLQELLVKWFSSKFFQHNGNMEICLVLKDFHVSIAIQLVQAVEAMLKVQGRWQKCSMLGQWGWIERCWTNVSRFWLDFAGLLSLLEVIAWCILMPHGPHGSHSVQVCSTCSQGTVTGGMESVSSSCATSFTSKFICDFDYTYIYI